MASQAATAISAAARAIRPRRSGAAIATGCRRLHRHLRGDGGPGICCLRPCCSDIAGDDTRSCHRRHALSPLEAAASAIDLHNTAAAWNKALLDNSARASGALVYTSREGNLSAEQFGLALITQSWSYMIDRWPRSQRLNLPLRPVQAIASVKLWRQDGSPVTLPSTSFLLDGQGQPARLVWQGAAPIADPERTANGIEIAFTAGFGAAAGDVPSPLRHALLLLVAHWYEHREPIEIGTGITAIPQMVSDLLVPYRRRRV